MIKKNICVAAKKYYEKEVSEVINQEVEQFDLFSDEDEDEDEDDGDWNWK